MAQIEPQPQEFIDKAIEHYRKCNEKNQKQKKTERLVVNIIGSAIIGPLAIGVIVGLLSVVIKFIGICFAWIGLL